METASTLIRATSPAPSTDHLPVNSGRRPIPPLSRRWGIVVICCYALWAFVIPIKNVIMIAIPKLRPDSVQTETSDYRYDRDTFDSSVQEVAGTEIVPLLRQIMAITVGNRAVREHLESLGAFDIDNIHHLLSPDEFQTLSLYYALVFQATEFPAGTFTPRPRYFASNSEQLPLDALGLWIQPASGGEPWLLSISCAPENAAVEGTQCFQDTTDYVCYDFPVAGERRTYKPVSLNASRQDSGLSNNVGLLYIIEFFHTTLNKLISTKSWNKTLESISFLTGTTNEETALQNGFTSVYHDGIPKIHDKFTMEAASLRVSDLQTTTLESCFMSEIITHTFYTRAFVLDLIESALIDSSDGLFGVDERNRLEIPRQRINASAAALFDHRILLTSGSRPRTQLSSSGMSILGGWKLTSITGASTRFKFDKKMQSVDTFGSSLRMILMAAHYPEYYTRYTHSVVQDPVSARSYDEMQFSLLGGAMSGLYTFKTDWWANTMEVYKLAELPHSDADSPKDPWWDEEVHFANWFQQLEASSDAPFYTLSQFIDIEATGVYPDDNPVTRCHRAFYKTLAKITWLSLLTYSALPTYLMYMSNANGGARPWFVSTIKLFQLHGETVNGARYPFSYSVTSNTRKDDGSAWVVVPILQAMIDMFGHDRTIEMILTEFNSSFPLFVTTEYGLVHFPDSAQCKVGFKTSNVSSDTNTMDKITKKFYPGVAEFVKKAVFEHEFLYGKMSNAIALHGQEMVTIPREMVLGTRSTPKDVGVVGSPIFWKPSALTAGLLRFWPAGSPPPSVVSAYRNATVCYRTLELRYLNESVRCWVEPNSVTRSRTSYDSTGLRYVIWCNWSISWVLNAIAIFIALRFVQRFVVAFKITRFRCVSFWVALQFNLQSIGILSFPQVILMAISSLPLLIAYHLPTDPVFMIDAAKILYPKVVRDCIVTLSATWFIRLGYDSVNQCVRLDDIHLFYNNFRLRLGALAFIFVIRLSTPDLLNDANYEVSKFVATCSISIALGVCCAILPFYLYRHNGKITPLHVGPHFIAAKSQSIVIKQLVRDGMPLNHNGLLGFSPVYGWSLTGLIVEGWEVVERKHKNQVIVAKGRCRVPLQLDRDGRIECLL